MDFVKTRLRTRVVRAAFRVRPRAILVRSATGTHRELGRLYEHAKDVLGEVYLPEAVLAQTLDGMLRPALCYISPGNGRSSDVPRLPRQNCFAASGVWFPGVVSRASGEVSLQQAQQLGRKPRIAIMDEVALAIEQPVHRDR